MKTPLKRFLLLLAGILIVFSLNENTRAYDFNKYNFIPPFIDAGEAPSVLLMCDTSGSMDHFAYAFDFTGDQYDQNTVYYGYFDPYAYYRYVKCEDAGDTEDRSGFFEENTAGWTDTQGEFHGNYDGDEDGVDSVDPGDTGIGVGNYEWSGNFLNYISMRRMDVLKRVLMGGRRAPDDFGNIIDNAPAGYDTGAAVNPLDYLVVGDHGYYTRDDNTCNDYKVPLPPGPGLNEAAEQALGKPTDSRFLSPYGTGAGPVALQYDKVESPGCGAADLHIYYYRFELADGVAIPAFEQGKLLALKLPAGEQPQGIVQRTGRQVRFGVMRFNKADNEGGTVLVPVGNTDHLCTPISGSCGSVCGGYGVGNDDIGDGFRMNGVIKAINDIDADQNTPLGESLATAVLYYEQDAPNYHDPGDFTQSKEWDPYFFNKDMNKDCSVGADEGEYVVCSSGYVIVLTDGEPTSDDNIPGWAPNYNDGGNDGTLRIDDVARYAHITDLRPNDETHDSETYEFSTVDNTLGIYPIFTFGTGGDLLRSTARNGGFIDKNSDDIPNTVVEEAAAVPEDKEWDFDGDGEPDNYFEAMDGAEIEASLITALADILKRAASGTAASIIAGSREGSGAVFQSLFYPEMTEPSGTATVAWTGYLHALFMDEYGNMWEDWNENDVLDIPGDRIVQLHWSDMDSATKVRFYTARLSNGEPDPASLHADSSDGAKNNITNIKPIWEAGKKLSEWTDTDLQTQRTYNVATGGRYIFTWVDSSNNGQVGGDGIPDSGGEVMGFTDGNLADFQNYFDLPAGGDPDYISPSDLVQWIRGIDITGYRSREIDFDDSGAAETWRLGDIIYSTPTIVGPPAEALDLIYRDESYRSFYHSNKGRRQVIYTGANDGMLHAFNAGFYDEDNHQYLTHTGAGETQFDLGQELWAFIPFDLLPHLQALPQIDYDPVHGNHVCFVDLKPRVMDVRFADNSWHTVLVCGMRLGGGEVTVNGDTLKSAYFALDITDPESAPKLLWSFNDTHGTNPVGGNRLGFTTSYPGVINVYDGSGNIKNYVVLGSGLTTINPNYPTSATSPYPVKSNQQARLYAIDIETGTAKVITTLTESNSYFGDFVAIDLNYKVEDLGAGNSIRCYASELGYVGISYDHDGSFDTAAKGKIYRLRAMSTTDGSSIMDPASWSLSLLCDVDKPVTSAPNVTVAGIRNHMDDYRAYINDSDADTKSYVPLVYFGTGEYWFSKDKEDRSQQTFYGIKEPISIGNNGSEDVYEFTWGSVNRSHLMDVTDTLVYTNGWIDMDGDGAISQWAIPPADPVGSATWLNSWADDPPHFEQWIDYLMQVDLDGAGVDEDHFGKFHGWKTDLNTVAERVIGQPGVLGGVVVFISYLPSDEVCVSKGDSTLYALHYLTGSAYYATILGEDASHSVNDGSETYNASEDSTDLGTGMGITPSFHTKGDGGNVVAYIQTSTGEIKEIDVDSVIDVLPPGIHLRSWLK